MSLRRIAAFALDLLGGDVIGSAHRLGELGKGQAPRPLLAGDAEIDQLDAVLVDPP